MDIQRGFRLGPWTVSPLSGEIESDGRSVHLEPKVMEVLVVLAEKAGQVVLRDEILSSVWGPRAEIADEPLTRCIAQARQALGDDSRDPKYIKTVPRRGYRLLMPVEPSASSASVGEDDQAGSVPQLPRRSLALEPWQGAGLISAVIVLGAAAWFGSGLMRGASPVPGPLEHCKIEQYADSARRIDPEAQTLCEEGLMLMEFRDARAIREAMRKFWSALAIDDRYGSAYFNLARAMVLLPTYEDALLIVEEDCKYDDDEFDQEDCFDAAIRLLANNSYKVLYLDDYTEGIRGYVYTKRWEFVAALGAFELAKESTPNDADMYQWLSQLHAATGNFEAALDAIRIAYNLDPNSGVIVDRYGVLLMWLGRDAEAEAMFAEAETLGHTLYEPSQLVLDIRNGEWSEVSNKLLKHAKGTRIEDASWIGPFIDGIRDPALRAEAVRAVELAIERNDLRGQYRYAALVYLGQADRAFDEAHILLRADPNAFDIEFLFAAETRPLRNHERFIELIEALGLDRYWSDDPSHCPPIFDRDDEFDWCDEITR